MASITKLEYGSSPAVYAITLDKAGANDLLGLVEAIKRIAPRHLKPSSVVEVNTPKYAAEIVVSFSAHLPLKQRKTLIGRVLHILKSNGNLAPSVSQLLKQVRD